MECNKNYIFQPQKIAAIENAIKNSKFPILISGPSGSGKTFCILKALENLLIKSIFVDLSQVKVRKCMLKNTVVIAYLYNLSDLKNVLYDKSLIIETTLENTSHLERFNIIKFDMKSFSSKADRKRSKMHMNTKNAIINSIYALNERIGLYRFLGKIFYRKMSIKDIDIENDYIIISQETIPKSEKTQSQQYSKILPIDDNFSKNESSSEVEIITSRRNTKLNIYNDYLKTKTEYDKLNGNVKKSKSDSNASFAAIDETSIPELEFKQTFSLDGSLEDFSFFSEDMLSETFNNDPQDVGSESMGISKIKHLFAEEKCNRIYSQSFSAKKIESYIFANYPFFASNNYTSFYECLSLTDTNNLFYVPLIQCLLASGCQGGYKFHSFASNKYDNVRKHAHKQDFWRYSQRL